MKQAVLCIIGLCFLVMGCASPAEVGNMVVDQHALVSATVDTPFRNNLAIKYIGGGEETNPMWTSEVSNAGFEAALKGSLDKSGLLAPSPNMATFDVSATLEELDQPIFGLDLQVKSLVQYKVVERNTQKAWLDQPIIASFTATFSDAAIAIRRLRLANEGAIRTNITQFIERLMTAKAP